MLSANKLKELCKRRDVSVGQLADQLVRGGLSREKAVAAVKNWQKGLFKPSPRKEDIRHLAAALSVHGTTLVSSHQ